MEKQHQFTSFSLFRAPGFPSHTFPDPPPFHSGLNVVYGPNGVGKTTLVRSLRSLLYATEQQKNVEAEATLVSGEQRWHLSLSQGKLVQKRLDTGEQTLLPGRNDEYAEAYWFPLHELLEKESSNSVFLQAIQKEMQGGIDLQQALHNAEGLSSFSNGRIQLAKRVKETYDAVAQARTELLVNATIKDEIRELEKELLRLPKLTQLLNHQKAVQAYLLQKAEQQTLHTRLDSYDQRLANLGEHTLDDVLALEKTLKQAKDTLSEVVHSIESDSQKLSDLHLSPAFQQNNDLLSMIAHRLDAIKDLEAQVRSAKKDAQAAQEALMTWEEQLAWLVAKAPEQTSLQTMVTKLTELMHACEPLRCNLALTEATYREAGEIVALDASEPEKLLELKTTLLLCIKTLAKLQSLQKTKPYQRWPLIVGASVLSVLGSILGLVFSPGLGFLGTALLAGFLLFITKKTTNEEYRSLKGLLDTYQGQLEKQKLSFGLDSFDLEGLSALLGTVVARISAVGQIALENEKRRNVKQAYEDAKHAHEAWLKAWNEASSELHLTGEPMLQGSQFFNFSSQLKDWLVLLSKVQQTSETFLDLQKELQAETSDLAVLCELPDEQRIDIRARASQLAENLRSAKNLQERLDALENQRKREQKKVEDAEANLQALYAKFELDLHDLQGLQMLQQNYGEYRGLLDQMRAVKLLLDGFSAEVGQRADETTYEYITQALQQTEQDIAYLQNVEVEKAKKQERFSMLCSDTKLEEALFAYETAKDALQQQRAKEVQQRMVSLFFEEIKQQTESTYVPQVLKRAGMWLLRITANRFSLGMGNGTFTALDTTLNRSFSLSELSSGTRVQVLFAVRMAFLEMLESGSEYHFPIFFDELMANSDDQRSMSIAQAIVEIAKDRQVFYCTAQMDEVIKLKEVAQGKLEVIRLEDEKRKYRLQESPFTAVKVERTPIIELVEDYQEYAKALGVCAPQLHEPVGGISSWFLCNESRELEQLLSRGFATAGQAERVGQPYQSRFELLAKAQALAIIGRPRVFTVHDASDENLKLNRSTTYYENLQVFLQEERRTGNDVLAAIENKSLKGFRDSAKDTLLTYMEEHAFSTADQMYPLSEILNRLCLDNPQMRVDSDEYGLVHRYLKSLDIEN
ncbi:AAA family ATPase [Sphaerochaeta globosa]|uniref:Rad50/SbcC-type AAA domain-containing protein n=1 Tax=Sphaerochaeta globosa (strain ATCC BAA-1886 / DSM 22777 / Buddy) TaxID=158189 RepID=F0RW56_SPHGB|nr:AAA family ATPase [Sphaerochaeta globosa]ADY13413.1 hypothetical protein SpiBuddy_1588 [Sphaerochaeta globosa str. Buddy]